MKRCHRSTFRIFPDTIGRIHPLMNKLVATTKKNPIAKT